MNFNMDEDILNLDEDGRDDPDSAMGGFFKKVAKTIQDLVFPYQNHLPKLRQMEEDQHISFDYIDIFRPAHLSDYLEKAKEQREKEIEVREKKNLEETVGVQQFTEAKTIGFKDTSKLITLEAKNVEEKVTENLTEKISGTRMLELKDTGLRNVKSDSKEKEQKIIEHVLDILEPSSLDSTITEPRVRGCAYLQQKNQHIQQKNTHQVHVESKKGAFKSIETKIKPKLPVPLKTPKKNLLELKTFRDQKPLEIKNGEKSALDLKVFNVKTREPKYLELKVLDPKPKIFPASRNFREPKPMPRLNFRRK